MNRNKAIAFLFFLLSCIFIAAAAWSQNFFDWVYARHHNQLSWYIRPLFLIPFCYFAYRRSLAGISITVFLLFTSMFWFNAPQETSPEVAGFLEYEKSWLRGKWDASKVLLTFTVPLSLGLLAFAFWKRSMVMGMAVLVLIAGGKMLWSVMSAGEVGKSVFLPAVAGLCLCVVLVFLAVRKFRKQEKASQDQSSS